MADAGLIEYNFAEIASDRNNFTFNPLTQSITNLGFTENYFWVKFSLHNNTSEHLIYYLETARPITDEVELYLTDQTGKTVKQKSGDKIPFLNRVL
ncbi:MAG: hybrid sensor histidine kinase/response regulator, partial [Bacteroidia bacterium]|nr:hybrid sensor histidine kinase/response regulator [Bacteroidia bacterium]